MNAAYSLHLNCHHKGEILYVQTRNHFLPACPRRPISTPWVGLGCVVYSLQCYGWRRGGGAEIGHLLAVCTLLSSCMQYTMSLFFWVYLHFLYCGRKLHKRDVRLPMPVLRNFSDFSHGMLFTPMISPPPSQP